MFAWVEGSDSIRIERVECLLFSRLHDADAQWFTLNFRTLKADAVVARVTTTDGVVGLGEICSYGGPRVVASWVDWLSRAMVGRSLAQAWSNLRPRGTSWAHDGAVAGLDCALWDIVGKVTGKPVGVLLGASPDTESVAAYASGGCRYDWREDPYQVVTEVLGYKEQGFDTSKIRLGTEWAWDAVTPGDFLKVAATLRAELGPDFNLAVDGNRRLSRDQALDVARGLAELGFAWFEDPLDNDDIDGYVALRQAVPDLCISGGEVLLATSLYRPYLERGAFAMLHPDAGWMGMTEAYGLMTMAAEYGVPCNPHGWHNGGMAMAHAQLIAAAPLPGKVELNLLQGPLRDGLIAGGVPVRDGRIQLPGTPGLGFELAPDAESKFPFLDYNYYAVMER